MSLIKEAFVEGRETDVEWELSKSKKKELKLEVAISNMETMSSKEYHKIIPLQQICPDTGKVIRTFPSRLAAAKWIVENVLKRPEKNPISITGNMEMCMRGGWKSYGYYWKTCDLQKVTSKAEVAGGQKVFIRKAGKDAVFASLTEAANFIGINRKTLSARLKDNRIYFSGNTMAQFYNEKPKTVTYATMTEACRKTGIGDSVLRKMLLNKVSFNNYTFYTEKKYKPKYTLYKGAKIVGTYGTATEVAKIMQASVDTVRRYAASGKAFGILKYRIKKT